MFFPLERTSLCRNTSPRLKRWCCVCFDFPPDNPRQPWSMVILANLPDLQKRAVLPDMSGTKTRVTGHVIVADSSFCLSIFSKGTRYWKGTWMKWHWCEQLRGRRHASWKFEAQKEIYGQFPWRVWILKHLIMPFLRRLFFIDGGTEFEILLLASRF